ncbi:nickel-dependent hydrogenase large subunit [Bradyrhizobium sp. RT5a]|uniref:nickel-dependent hydrogenase large subunit n=1 Tax=unclassified Bradyrhizobium TaxID=2631580 RepID=UPI00339AF237
MSGCSRPPAAVSGTGWRCATARSSATRSSRRPPAISRRANSFNVGGQLEQALVGTAVGDAGPRAVAIQHIVRSFDPCMVCTAH